MRDAIFTASNGLVEQVLSILQQPPPIAPVLAGYCSKVIVALFKAAPESVTPLGSVGQSRSRGSIWDWGSCMQRKRRSDIGGGRGQRVPSVAVYPDVTAAFWVRSFRSSSRSIGPLSLIL